MLGWWRKLTGADRRVRRIRLLEEMAAQEHLSNPTQVLDFVLAHRFLLTGDEGANLWLSPVLREFSYDAGIGLDIDGLAVYLAMPVGRAWDPRLTLRLLRRF